MRRVEPPIQQQKVIDKDEWFDKLRAAKVDKQDMNMLMMDYFIKEGFADAAAAFKEESLTEPVTLGNTITPVDLSTLASRTAVRDAVQKGDMLKALDKINELDPGILEERPKLSFRLLQERLIELIQCVLPPPATPPLSFPHFLFFRVDTPKKTRALLFQAPLPSPRSLPGAAPSRRTIPSYTF